MGDIMKLNYLHLSDFHFDGSQNGSAADIFNQDRVNTSMLAAIEKLNQGGNDFDFIIITGNLARKGKKEDYAVARLFCKKLLSATGLSYKQLFIIPGNHDVDRSQFKMPLCQFNKQDDITNILRDPEILPF